MIFLLAQDDNNSYFGMTEWGRWSNLWVFHVMLKGKSAVFIPLVIPLSKSFFQLMTGLWGTCCFNGNPAYFTFSLFSVISSLLIYPIFICALSFTLFVCVPSSSLALEQYFLHEGLLAAILSLIAVDSTSSSHSKGPAFHTTPLSTVGQL